MNRDEARRIADALQPLRADWSIAQVMAVLGHDQIRLRSYRDVAIAAVAVALDPTTRQPTRLLDKGPWWDATRPFAPVIQLYRRPTGLDCRICSQPEAECRRRIGDHVFDPRPQEPAPPPADLFDTPSPATPATRED